MSERYFEEEQKSNKHVIPSHLGDDPEFLEHAQYLPTPYRHRWYLLKHVVITGSGKISMLLGRR